MAYRRCSMLVLFPHEAWHFVREANEMRMDEWRQQAKYLFSAVNGIESDGSSRDILLALYASLGIA